MHRLLRHASLFLASLAFGLFAEGATDPSGTWTYEAPVQNRTIECTLDLQLKDGQLTGTLENRLGKVDIADAVYDDGRISFTVTREFRRRTFTTRYDGRIDNDSISGTIVATDKKGKERSAEWKAKRVG